MFTTRALVFIVALTLSAASSARASTGCPGGVLFETDPTGSLLDFGWSGISHRRPEVGYSLRLGLNCSASTPPCGTCSITGLLPNAGGNNLRCVNDTSIHCTPSTDVTDCGAPAGKCHFFSAPPNAMGTGGVGSCWVSDIVNTVTGTADPDSGDLFPNVPLQMRIFLGGTLDNPCPRCIGDGAVNDNVRGGTCDAGPRIGLTCDANAVAEWPDFGATSFDCPPPPASEIGALTIGSTGLSTGVQSLTLSASSPGCKAPGFTSAKCFCDTCNSGTTPTPCRSDADCIDPPGPIGPICGGKRCVAGSNAGAACTLTSECPAGVCGLAGTASATTGCIDDTNTPALDGCTDTAPIDGEGECDVGPVDNSCSIASGHPQRGCLNDSDCGGSPGSCQTVPRICFPNTGTIGESLSSVGFATPPVGNTSDPTILAGVACMSPTNVSAANTVLGLPGPARQTFVGSAIFAEEMVAEVVPPGGTVTTSGSGPASVVETSVTSPNAGEVTIIGTFNTGTPPSGYTFLGRLVQIEAPAASPASPLSISFDIVASEIPSGENENTIQIFRNGVGPIPNCLGSTQAVPSPCITARTALGGGDVRITILTAAASEWTMAVGPPAPPTGPNKCTEGKEKCVSKRQACKLACLAKAESGIFDPAPCLQKCEDKFDGGVNPSKGCFAKLEAKYGGTCFSTGDTAALETTVDNFVTSVLTQIEPGFPSLSLTKCAAGKNKCVNKKTACKLGCHSKAHGKGVAVDPSCLGKCEDKFDGGADPTKGCFAKLETKYTGSCPTTGDTAALEATVDAFVDDAVCQLNGPGGGTCP